MCVLRCGCGALEWLSRSPGYPLLGFCTRLGSEGDGKAHFHTHIAPFVPLQIQTPIAAAVLYVADRICQALLAQAVFCSGVLISAAGSNPKSSLRLKPIHPVNEPIGQSRPDNTTRSSAECYRRSRCPGSRGQSAQTFGAKVCTSGLVQVLSQTLHHWVLRCFASF